MVQGQDGRTAFDVRRAEAAALAALFIIDDQARDIEGSLVLNAVDDRRRRCAGQGHADRPVDVDDIDVPGDDAVMIRRNDTCFRRARLDDSFPHLQRRSALRRLRRLSARAEAVSVFSRRGAEPHGAGAVKATQAGVSRLRKASLFHARGTVSIDRPGRA